MGRFQDATPISARGSAREREWRIHTASGLLTRGVRAVAAPPGRGLRASGGKAGARSALEAYGGIAGAIATGARVSWTTACIGLARAR